MNNKALALLRIYVPKITSRAEIPYSAKPYQCDQGVWAFWYRHYCSTQEDGALIRFTVDGRDMIYHHDSNVLLYV